MTRERVEKSKSVQRREEVQAENAKTSKAEDLKADLDDVLEEIDGVLEENAEEFVKGYVQKGGQ